MRVERLNQEPWRPSTPRAKKVPLCPECGVKGLRIVYGMPDGPFPPEGCTWGGCCITGDDPKYACSECDATWGSLKGPGRL